MKKWKFSVEVTVYMNEGDQLIEAETAEEAKDEIANYVDECIDVWPSPPYITHDSICKEFKITSLIAEGEEVDYGER